jgi:trans-AT polyketide synthase, acyltransferase and oxidoreductase domains
LVWEYRKDNSMLAIETMTNSVDQLRDCLLNLDTPLKAIQAPHGIEITCHSEELSENHDVLAWVPSVTMGQFGDPGFLRDYGVQAAYYAGAMANAIASTEMVIALGKAGLMGSYGAGGVSPQRIEEAIQEIQSALPNGPYAFNLLHSPFEPQIERHTVELYLRYGVRVVEAAAFIRLSDSLVQYRAAGLSEDEDGGIIIANHIIAKLSRTEVAKQFLQPAPDKILDALVTAGRITAEQARLARLVPVADDITVEADSGGHTDQRPLVCLLPTMLALRDEIQAKYKFAQLPRVGVGGGIGTPESVLAAYMMGAAYVVTGSINHASVEAGTSTHTKQLLASAAMTDVAMAPSADMFEMGGRVQVLKKGTLFAMRAQKLYEVYSSYASVEEIPPQERERLEKKTFQRPLAAVWSDTEKFFEARDPTQLEKARKNPKMKMALIFRWYLGLASRWSCIGESGREMDYQIWCGPVMGTFNDWARGTYLEQVENRHAADIALQLLYGCSYRYRLQSLRVQGIQLPAALDLYRPESPLVVNQ